MQFGLWLSYRLRWVQVTIPTRTCVINLTLTLTLPVPHVDLGAGLLQYADNTPTIITLVGMVAVGMVRVGMVPAPRLRYTCLQQDRLQCVLSHSESVQYYFYRTMLCIARTMPSQDVRLSIRPSVTRWYSVETARHILELFSPLGSPAILCFPYQMAW